MNKTEQVSIGRRGFVCDQDAYRVLQDYLERSSKALGSDPDKDEIMTDLEASMAGHLAELTGNLVVDKSIASKVIERMGEVNAPEETEEGPKTSDKKSDEDLGERLESKLRALFKKPLYKDHSRQIGDGVCAGIANALDIDPLWVRLLFVALTILTQGFWIVIYVVLSVIMKDPEDYKGRNATEVIDNIKDKIQQGVSKSRPYEQALRKLFVGIAKLVWGLLRFIVCLVLIATSIAWASFLFFTFASPDQSTIFGAKPGWLEFVTIFSAGLLLLIPLFELLYAMFRPRRNKSRLSLALWSIWALSLIVAAAGIVNIYPKVETYLKRERPKNKYVYVQMVGNEIASLCVSPLGTCGETNVLLEYGTRCNQNVSFYDKDDRVWWMQRMWEPVYKKLPYPATEEQYCNELKKAYDQRGLGSVMATKDSVNDPANIYEETDPATGVVAKYWNYEYLIR